MKRLLIAAAGLLLVPVVLLAAAVGALGGGPDLTMPVGARGATGLAVAAAHAGFTGQALRLAIAVGLAESHGDPTARGPNPPTPGCPTGSTDRGAWQLNTCYHPEVSDACADDLACAALETYRISAAGSDWTAWTTYTSGAYQAQVPAADQAIATLAAPSTNGGVPPGYGTPGPCGLSPATDYTRRLVAELFGVTDIGGCALFSGHVENSDHYPVKPASSGLLTALWRVNGGEFAELTLVALLRNRGSRPCRRGVCCQLLRLVPRAVLPSGALHGDAAPAASRVPEDGNVPGPRGRAAQRASHAPTGPATTPSTAQPIANAVQRGRARSGIPRWSLATAMPTTDPTNADRASSHASVGWNHPHTPAAGGANSGSVKVSHLRRPHRRRGADGDPGDTGSGLAWPAPCRISPSWSGWSSHHTPAAQRLQPRHACRSSTERQRSKDGLA